MFTPGSAGGQSVLVWEGPAALRAAGVQVGAGQWCDKVDPVVVSYHTGGKNRSSSGLPQEMTRQLDGQFTALSLMSAKEILAGMATFDERKRSPASHTAIRKDFQKQLTENLWKRHHFPPEVAGLWASRAMGELAVLHNPDQLLSGPQGPSLVGGVVALGDRATNSAVGAQTAQGPRELIRDAAQAAVDAGQGDRLLQMRVVLTDSPDLAKDLNERWEALEPRSLAEREAVSPRGPPLTPQVLSDRLAQALDSGPDGLEDLTRDELRQALTQPPPQTPDHPDTPTPDAPAPDGLDTPTPDGLGTDAPETGVPDRGAPGVPVSTPQAPAPVEPVARPTDTSPSMSAPTPDLNAPDRNAPDKAAPDRSAPEQNAHEQNRPDRVAPEASAPDRAAPEQARPDKGTPDAGSPSGPTQVPGAGRTTPPSAPPVSAEPPARSQRAASPATPKQPAQPAQQNQPGQPGRQSQPGRPAQQNQPGKPGRPSGQPGRQGQSGRQVRSGRSGVPGRGAAGAGTSGAPGVTARPEAPSRLQASQGTGTPPAPARPGPQAGPQAPAGPAQPAPQRSTTARTAGDSTPGRSTSGRVGGPTAGDTPSRRAGGRGTNTTPRTTPGSASRSASRSAGATASGARTGAQDPIKARLAPTGDSQRDGAIAGISSKLDKLRQNNQQRQPTQAPTRTHHPRR